jgi:two-component system sensor histidine kinase KdpD
VVRYITTRFIVWLRKRFRTIPCLSGCLAAVAFCTWFAFRLDLGLATAGFLYLVLVVLAAMYGGFRIATATSFIAVGCLDYFFVPPLLSFRVNSPAYWAVLSAFEFTALVVSRLAYTANVKRAEAYAQRRDSERLYQTSCRILLFDRSRDPGAQLTALIRETFELDSVVLFDAASTSLYAAGCNFPEMAQHARDAYCLDGSQFHPDALTWSCVVRLDAHPVGGLALLGGAISPLVANALASLCAIAMERSRSLERESRAEAARETEQLRAAVLDALGHDFKTPVTTIWVASSGLLAANGLSDTQTELLTVIEEQSKKLNDLSSRLLGTARLDSAHFEPRRKPLLLSRAVNAAIQGIESTEARTRFHVSSSALEAPVLADGKLISAALAQLLDNAVKYSKPESPIEIGVEGTGVEATISVRNQGAAIPPSDRERIFERFYRANATGHGPAGTGLGLSIVKRIVEAHRGRVWVESDAAQGTAFHVALPLALETVKPEASGERMVEVNIQSIESSLPITPCQV